MRRALFLFFAMGCTVHKPEISPDVSTRDIRIAVSLDASTPGRMVAALAGPGGDVILLPPDRVAFAKGTMEWPAVHVANGYAADVGDATGVFSVRLLRSSDESVDEPFIIPPPFSVKAPAAMSRSAGMTFAWDGQVPNGQAQFSMTGTCVANLTRALGTDTGTYTLNANELQSAGMIPTTCDVTLVVVRTWMANIASSNLEGFSANFSTSASTTFTSSP